MVSKPFNLWIGWNEIQKNCQGFSNDYVKLQTLTKDVVARRLVGLSSVEEFYFLYWKKNSADICFYIKSPKDKHVEKIFENINFTHVINHVTKILEEYKDQPFNKCCEKLTRDIPLYELERIGLPIDNFTITGYFAQCIQTINKQWEQVKPFILYK